MTEIVGLKKRGRKPKNYVIPNVNNNKIKKNEFKRRYKLYC